MKLLAKHMVSIKRDRSETKIYFRKDYLHPDEKQLALLIERGIAYGRCSGSDLSRLTQGEVVIYYNQLYHTPIMQKCLNKEVADFIRSSH